MNQQQQGVRRPYIKPEMQVEHLPRQDVIATSVRVQAETFGRFQTRVTFDSDWD